MIDILLYSLRPPILAQDNKQNMRFIRAHCPHLLVSSLAVSLNLGQSSGESIKPDEHK
jgi:hypothetical protein